MAPRVDTEDLIDATDVAEMLGLAQRNSVSLYQRRYRDMPRPVVERASGRIKLWSRREIARWGGPGARDRSAGQLNAGAEPDAYAFVREGAEVVAHITTRHAVELIASGAGDEERAMGEELFRRLKGDPDEELLTFPAIVVIPPKPKDLTDPKAVVAVRIPELDDEGDLFTVRLEELSPAPEG